MKSKVSLLVLLAVFFSGSAFAETLRCQVLSEEERGETKILLNRQILLGFDHSGRVNEPIKVGSEEPLQFVAVVSPSQLVRDRGTLTAMSIVSLAPNRVGRPLRGALFSVSPKTSFVESQTIYHPMTLGKARLSIQATCTLQ